MAEGGKREGAGRPKGSKNKATLAKQAEIAATGETPLDYMIRVMRDETVGHDRRDKMAAAAAPYVHSKLASVEHSGKDGGPIQTEDISMRERARRLADLVYRAAREAEE